MHAYSKKNGIKHEDHRTFPHTNTLTSTGLNSTKIPEGRILQLLEAQEKNLLLRNLVIISGLVNAEIGQSSIQKILQIATAKDLPPNDPLIIQAEETLEQIRIRNNAISLIAQFDSVPTNTLKKTFSSALLAVLSKREKGPDFLSSETYQKIKSTPQCDKLLKRAIIETLAKMLEDGELKIPMANPELNFDEEARLSSKLIAQEAVHELLNISSIFQLKLNELSFDDPLSKQVEAVYKNTLEAVDLLRILLRWESDYLDVRVPFLLLADFADYLQELVAKVHGLKATDTEPRSDLARFQETMLTEMAQNDLEKALGFIQIFMDGKLLKKPTDIKRLIGLTFSLINQQMLKEHPGDFNVKMTINANPLQDIPLDSTGMYEVFVNLIINAIHAMDNNGEIMINLSSDGIKTTVEFSDTGCGIPPQILTKIFEPYFTTKGENGTGLGLAIVKKIVNEHNGAISVESELNQGTKFTIILPNY